MDYDEAIKLFEYDPWINGDLRWKISPSRNVKAGDIAGCSDNNGYRIVRYKDKAYKGHRIAWLMVYKSFPMGEIDHINGNTNDNRIANLRDVTAIGNAQNQKKAGNNSSGAVGVHWCNTRKIWISRINDNGERINLGSYNNLFDAACARKAAEIEIGYHTNHGRA